MTARTLLALDAAAGPSPRVVDGDPAISALAVDSREVKAGTVFVALRGTRLDGAEFVPFALRQ
ncbi:MAG: Mur ligase domain-containing protein, partial [Pseudomonadota bacterium]